MQLNLDKHHFCKLDGIVGIKNHLGKVTNVSLKEHQATGNVEMNISYSDQEGLECFKSISLPFELDLAELKPIEIVLGKTDVFVVEGQGLDIQYELVVNYVADTNKPIEVLPEDEVTEIGVIPEEKVEMKEDQTLNEIKENISEFYEDQLADKLSRRDHVITTKSHEDPIDFLNFFENKKEYYKLKCLEVHNEEELKDIAQKYQVSLEKLYAGYDQKTRRVLFTL